MCSMVIQKLDRPVLNDPTNFWDLFFPLNVSVTLKCL